VVTGGASGIGRELVRAFAGAGTAVVIADIDADAARSTAREVADGGGRAMAVPVDVTSADSVRALADAAYDFGSGTVDILCNNAGVLVWGNALVATREDWQWILDVNLMGVVNGVAAFLPRMIEQGTRAHIVNTSSVAALRGSAEMPAYGASKAAVLSLSEALHAQLAATNVGVSVLCPANIESRILDAQRNRPSSRGKRAPEPMGTEPPGVGIHAANVAAAALDAIRNDELYVFTFPDDEHAALRAAAEQRCAAILEAIDRGGVHR
jgi:NAD(P)-dependent dehydrogenase (short-subunit alcohol dehydrogenase family)